MRQVILMVEVEQPEGLSARKLVLETARYNVISAYNEDDAINLIERFPNVDLAVVHTELENNAFESTVRRFRAVRRDLYIVAISPVGPHVRQGVDSVLSSHSPQQLLELLAARRPAASSGDR